MLGAPPLVREMKRDVWGEVIICECELLVTIISALLWGRRNEHSRIIILRTDNYNVFDRHSNWKEKMGTSSRMLRALIDYLIKWQIEIIPRFVRRGHNFSRDHLSRTDEQGISDWALNMGMTTVSLPDSWFELVDSWKPEVQVSELDRFDLQ